MPIKILHIGHASSPERASAIHVKGIVDQIMKYTDFNNVILSCTKPKKGYYSSNIPIYIYNYLNYLDTPKMRKIIEVIMDKEKPDLIIGHSFSQVAIPLNYACIVRDVPAIAVIWGYYDCIYNKKLVKSYNNNLLAINKLNYLACTNTWLNAHAIDTYGIDKDDFIETGPSINLKQYKDHLPSTKKPVLLLAKPRSEAPIYGSLSLAFKRFPNLEVHAFAVSDGISLAKKFNVYNKVIYHKYPQPQDKFAELIKKCNIVYTSTGDPGTGPTALQASYAGCINIMRRCSSSIGVFEDKKNVIMCTPKVEDVKKKLIYSIQNMKKLCKRFKNNNRHLIKYDAENTWKILYNGILSCLEGKKTKIIPTRKIK